MRGIARQNLIAAKEKPKNTIIEKLFHKISKLEIVYFYWKVEN